MGQLFGTDGIRGIAGETLDCPLAYRVGLATALVLGKKKEEKPVVMLGKDSRISSDMIEAALSAGLCAGGAVVVQLGVIATPAVAYLTVLHRAAAGVVISASHNPYQYNGIKIFNEKGVKLPDEAESEIERMVLSKSPLPTKKLGELGDTHNGRHESENYIHHLLETVTSEISDLRVLIDCANGSASKTARRIFSRFNIDVAYMNDQYNGTNINDQCGSTHLVALGQRVKAGCYDIGIAFDGDADRCLIVDENGNAVDGDRILAVCARALKAQGKLKNNGFVATIMSNLGLHKFAKENDMQLLCANVGDRHVLEMMQEKGMVLGGEQSGHIIFLEHMPTGDGQLAALQFLQILSQSMTTVSKLVAAVTQYPQVLLGITAPFASAEKQSVLSSEIVRRAIAEGEAAVNGDGRILVRASGTEALIRVMVEATTTEIAQQVAEQIAKSVENAQN